MHQILLLWLIDGNNVTAFNIIAAASFKFNRFHSKCVAKLEQSELKI